MTENIYGMLKKRFPVLSNMRDHYPNAKKTAKCTFILHNMAIKLNDPLPEDDEPLDVLDAPFRDDDDDDDDDNPGYIVVEDNAPREVIRRRGQERRQQMLEEMPPARRNERRRNN